MAEETKEALETKGGKAAKPRRVTSFAGRDLKFYSRFVEDGALNQERLKSEAGLNDAQIPLLVEALQRARLLPEPTTEAGGGNILQAAPAVATTAPLEAPTSRRGGKAKAESETAPAEEKPTV